MSLAIAPAPTTTPTDKSPSRRNALKHGLTGAGKVLPPDFEAPLAARLADWSASFNPTTENERWLVRRIALSTLRMDQCATLAAHLEHAHSLKDPSLHDLDRQIETHTLAARFDKDPLLTRLQLLRTREGTLHLARRWRTLTQAKNFPATPQAVDETLTLIANLLGIHPDHRPSSRQLNKLRNLLDHAIRPDAPPDDRASAHRRLSAFARRQSRQLRHHADTTLAPLADLEAARLAAGLALPNTADYRLARRYESAATREFHKALTLLRQLQTHASRPPHVVPSPTTSPEPDHIPPEYFAAIVKHALSQHPENPAHNFSQKPLAPAPAQTPAPRPAPTPKLPLDLDPLGGKTSLDSLLRTIERRPTR